RERAVEGLGYAPTHRALHWSGDTLLVSHYDVYGTGLRFAVNCLGSGFFHVPVDGGAPRPVAVPFCELDRSAGVAPDGRSVVFVGDPVYGREGESIRRMADAPILRLELGSL